MMLKLDSKGSIKRFSMHMFSVENSQTNCILFILRHADFFFLAKVFFSLAICLIDYCAESKNCMFCFSIVILVISSLFLSAGGVAVKRTLSWTAEYDRDGSKNILEQLCLCRIVII